jgi:hypothetical protein
MRFLGLRSVVIAMAATSDAATVPAPPDVAAIAPGFIRNDGQWNGSIRFGAQASEYVARIYGDGFEVARAAESYGFTEAVRFRFENPKGDFPLRPLRKQPGPHHFFYGSDPNEWHVDVPSFERLTFEGVAPEIDVELSFSAGRLQYDVRLGPNADLGRFGLSVVGHDWTVDDSGDLLITTRTGTLRFARPRAYTQRSTGWREEVLSGFRRTQSGAIGLSIAAEARGQRAVIDPGIEWSTFLGGVVPATGFPIGTTAELNLPFALETTASGTSISVGSTGRIDFPTTASAFDTTYSGSVADVWITELSQDGANLIFSTYFGGAGSDSVRGVDIASDGSIVIVGTTGSADFPIAGSGPYAVGPSGPYGSIFVARMAKEGDSLHYSVALFGQSFFVVTNAALSANEDVLIVGVTPGGFTVTPNAFDSTPNGEYDGFVTRLSADASSLVFSTYLGGSANDDIRAVASHPDGTVSVTGDSRSVNYPTTPGVFQLTKSAGQNADGVVTRFTADGSTLVSSTFVGGNLADVFTDIVVDRHDRVTMTGYSTSMTFPTTPGAFKTCCGGDYDAIVVRLTNDFDSLVFSTRFGGIGTDEGRRCRVDAAGNVIFCGHTFSDVFMGFPTTKGAWKESFLHDPSDGFVACLTKDGGSLYYSTLIGGSENDLSIIFNTIGMDVDGTGAATICGPIGSPDYPVTPGAFDTTWVLEKQKGGITRLDLLPRGVTKYGASSSGCYGPLAIGVDSMPYLGNDSFGVRCVGASGHAPGWLLVSPSALTTPQTGMGVSLFVDPATSVIVPVIADEDGEARLRQKLPFAGLPIGFRVFAQFVFRDPCAVAGIAASNALEIEIQAP